MFSSVTPDTMKFTYLPTHPPQNPTTLNHLLYFFAFGKKVLEMEKMRFLRRYYGRTLIDRDLKFSGSPRYILKTKTAKF